MGRDDEIMRLAAEPSASVRRIAARLGVADSTVRRSLGRRGTTIATIRARNALVSEHRGAAIRIAQALARSLPPQLREELPSVAQLALIECAAKFDPARNVPFYAYMRPRVHGACVDSVRRRRYAEATAPAVDTQENEARRDNAPDPEALAMAAESTTTRRALAQQVFDRLNGRQAILIWLHYIEGETLEEIAPKMGVVSSHVSQLHTDALRQLREGRWTG